MSSPLSSLESLKGLKKVGFIVPSSNVAVETLTTAMLSQLPLVTAHYSRISVTTMDLGATAQFSPELMLRCAKLLGEADVDCIVWNGTSESWTGEGYEAGVLLKDVIERNIKIKASTSSLAQVEVLREWGFTKIALATPYSEGPVKELYRYYERCGVKVLKDAKMGETRNNEVANTTLDRMRDLIREADHPDADCVVIPCTNLPSALVVEEMELELGKPIFDSIVVTLWKALRLAGVETPIHGWGRLLRKNHVLDQLDAVMDELRVKTIGSRATVRMDVPKVNCHVDQVIAESLAHGVPSLRTSTAINIRAVDTMKELEKTRDVLIQSDTINADIRPPKALMSAYGVRAQLLLPLLYGEEVIGLISVHYIPSIRKWSDDDVSVLKEAGSKVQKILKDSGWADIVTF